METAVCEIGTEASAAYFETIFRTYFGRVARVIARVVRDHARAEELAVEVFLKLWNGPRPAPEILTAWLYRVAVRRGLDDLRRKNRREHYERLLTFGRRVPNPEEILTESQDQERVRQIPASMEARQAELLVLRSHGLSYEELAGALGIHAASIGTLLSRAQNSFRRRYVRRYGIR